MSVAAVFGLVGTILGVISIAGVAFAYLRSNFAKTQVEVLTGELNAYKLKTDRLEHDHAQCQTDLKAARSELQAVNQKYDDLKNIVEEALRRPPGARTRRTDK